MSLDLTEFPNIEGLDIQRCKIFDIKGVDKLLKLKVFLAEESCISDIDAFIDLPELVWLDAPNTRI